MTTPRDDIAGLSERLRSPVWNDETMKGWDSWREMILKNRGSLPRDCFESFLDGIDEEREEAATQLDSLLKERDALQARVKELEGAFAKLSEMAKESETLRKNALTVAEQWQSRALRAEQERDELKKNSIALADTVRAMHSAGLILKQERDEAYERLKPFADFDHATMSANPDTCVVVQGRVPSTLTLAHFDATRDLVRRLAGPEKEKKE